MESKKSMESKGATTMSKRDMSAALAAYRAARTQENSEEENR